MYMFSYWKSGESRDVFICTVLIVVEILLAFELCKLVFID